VYFRGVLKPVINDFLSLIYPPACPACENLLAEHEPHLCFQCQLNLPYCLPPSPSVHSLENRFKGRIPFENIAACFMFEKGNRVQNLLHSIKYKENKNLAHALGVLLVEKLGSMNFFKTTDLLLPVPLHRKKLSQRGFNQSEVFTSGLSEKSGIPMHSGLLIRDKMTQTQTRKHLYERWLNVETGFKVKYPEMLVDKHVILVDDVITTGATLDAAWQAMKDVPGIRISILALAYATRA
jgi:ComF family protein